MARMLERIASACSSWQAVALSTGSVVAWATFGWWWDVLAQDWYMMPAVTVMSIVSYICPFVILYAQARDADAVQIKLAELVHAVAGARDEVATVECADDQERERLRG